MRNQCIICILLLFFSTNCFAGASPQESLPPLPIRERVIKVPLSDGTDMSVVFMLPHFARERYPLVIFNPGTPQDASVNSDFALSHNYGTYYFLSRGYAVAVPIMRGYAGTGGRRIARGCDQAAMGIDMARDIKQVADFLLRIPAFAGRPHVVAGLSMGGWNSFAYASLAPRGLAGVVSFAGGLRAIGCADDRSVDALRAYGRTAGVPSLWVFGSNDSIFPRSKFSDMFAAWSSGAAHGTWLDIGRLGNDSHMLLHVPSAIGLWSARVDAFLGSVGMPSAVLDAGYLPTPVPNGAPWDGASLPKRFLSSPSTATLLSEYGRFSKPKALALGRGGTSTIVSGGFDPIAASLAKCRSAGDTCSLWLVDDMVVGDASFWR